MYRTTDMQLDGLLTYDENTQLIWHNLRTIQQTLNRRSAEQPVLKGLTIQPNILVIPIKGRLQSALWWLICSYRDANTPSRKKTFCTVGWATWKTLALWGLFLHPLSGNLTQIPSICNGTYTPVALEEDFLHTKWDVWLYCIVQIAF